MEKIIPGKVNLGGLNLSKLGDGVESPENTVTISCCTVAPLGHKQPY